MSELTWTLQDAHQNIDEHEMKEVLWKEIEETVLRRKFAIPASWSKNEHKYVVSVLVHTEGLAEEIKQVLEEHLAGLEKPIMIDKIRDIPRPKKKPHVTLVK
jgi:hypothetical protein